MRIPDRNMTPPEESTEDGYINDMADIVKQLNTQIEAMTDELADFKIMMNDFRYLDLMLKQEMIDRYNEKIDNRQSKLDGIKRNLANSYGVVI